MKITFIAVICTDSSILKSWSPLIEARAREAGWLFGVEPVGIPEDETAKFQIIVTLDPYEALPSDTAIILAAPQGEWEEPRSNDLKKSVERDSFRLMQTSMFAIDRAEVLDATSTKLNIPGLSEIKNPNPPQPVAGRSPLAIYDVIPPPLATKALWPAAMMRFPQGRKDDGGLPLIDLTGRARVLAHGPYVTLMPGVWRITYTVMIDPQGGVSSLVFEWGGASMVKEQIKFSTPGIYQCQQTHTWTSAEPAQVRISLAQALFQGRFELMDMTVDRIGNAPEIIPPK